VWDKWFERFADFRKAVVLTLEIEVSFAHQTCGAVRPRILAAEVAMLIRKIDLQLVRVTGELGCKGRKFFEVQIRAGLSAARRWETAHSGSRHGFPGPWGRSTQRRCRRSVGFLVICAAENNTWSRHLRTRL
jgi:hypothetical protein